MSDSSQYSDNDLTEVKQLGLFAAIGSLSYVFWLVGGMELIERLAYYGVKASAGLYAKTSAAEGGLGITLSDYGLITMTWALMQTFVPVLTGGISDRVGYKETIFASTVIKIAGYLTMAFFPSFWGFMSGAILLAIGTGIFKPGIQGTLVLATERNNSSMAWGIFYQTVNIGGFLGPILAGHFRQLAWENVFFVCAAIISLNFICLLLYKEPGKEERIERNRKIKAGEITEEPLWKAALIELKKPIVVWYMLVFSGFWFMFNALFDVLPIHIQEWVDTSVIVTDLFGESGVQSSFVKTMLTMSNDGSRILPEGMLNINAFLIMTTCFLIAALSGKFRVTTAMLIGAIASCVTMVILGMTAGAWIAAFAIALFSVGEMLISPKKNEFMGNIAPEGKKAMYLGFVMLPQGIGWTIEGYWGPRLYEIYASKDIFAKQLLLQRGMSPDEISAIPQGEGFSTLVSYTGESAQALTQLLYQTHNIGMAWYIIGGIGSLSAIGIFFYGRWIYKLQQNQ